MAVEQLCDNLLDETALISNEINMDLPRTHEEAISGPEVTKWKAAMDKEMQTLLKMGTWKIGDLPEEKKTKGWRWV